MDLRERQHPERQRRNGTPADDAGNTDNPAAEQAGRFADIAERVIDRVLSPDSARFMRDRRQEGGQ